MPSVIYIQSILYQYFTIGASIPLNINYLQLIRSILSFGFAHGAFPSNAARLLDQTREEKEKKLVRQRVVADTIFFFFLDLKCSRQLITITTFESYVSRKSYHKSWLRNVTLICNYVILCTLN